MDTLGVSVPKQNAVDILKSPQLWIGQTTQTFIAHIAGMDTFARAFEITLDLLENSSYQKMKIDRYASFDSGNGARFEHGELSLEQLSEIAKFNGEPHQISGKQELYEAIINQYIK